uniref:Uncharacterized protein n=1 Tax=Arion vulgaris TaxID=1028688 RepID=A0A0B6Z9F5_9EUPU
MATRLTLDLLQSLTPYHSGGQDVVTEASRDLLVGCIKCEPKLHSVFFPNFASPPGLKLVEYRTFPIDVLSTTFIAEAISKIKDPYCFHRTINQSVVEAQLREVYDSLHWKKLGFQLYTILYPDVVRDSKTNVCLRDFMGGDGHVWAEKLMAHIAEPNFIRHIHQGIVRGRYTEAEYNRDMNAIFVKLHLLDPQSVIPAYQFLLNQRALPAVNLELATRNYLGPRLEWSRIQYEVENAERKAKTPLTASRLSLTSDIDVYYGTHVEEFIVTECGNFGLWTGVRPNNYKVVTAKERCHVM